MVHHNIIRDIKISKISNIPLNEESSKFVKFWDELWFDMKIEVYPQNGLIRCWKEGYNYYYFAQNSKYDDYLRCDYSKVWSFFKLELGFSYVETREFIHIMMREKIKCEICPPKHSNRMGVVTL